MKVSVIIHGLGTGTLIGAGVASRGDPMCVYYAIAAALMFADGVRALLAQFAAVS